MPSALIPVATSYPNRSARGGWQRSDGEQLSAAWGKDPGREMQQRCGAVETSLRRTQVRLHTPQRLFRQQTAQLGVQELIVRQLVAQPRRVLQEAVCAGHATQLLGLWIAWLEALCKHRVPNEQPTQTRRCICNPSRRRRESGARLAVSVAKGCETDLRC